MKQSKGKKSKQLVGPKPHQALASISATVLQGILDSTSIWLPLTDAVASSFDSAGVGTLGGADDLLCAKMQSAFSLPTPHQGPVVKLTLTEAMFLAHSLKSLTVWEDQGPLDAQALWRVCCERIEGFAWKFVAYHHFKAKGYIVKSGLQYGADYVLYAAHPAHAHSEFCVLLMRSGGGVDDASEFSWNDLEIANRLINQVEERVVCRWVPEVDIHKYEVPSTA